MKVDEAFKIVNRLIEERDKTKQEIIDWFGEKWDSDDPLENCRNTPIYDQLKTLEKILGEKP